MVVVVQNFPIDNYYIILNVHFISILIIGLFGLDQGWKGFGVCKVGYKLEVILEQFASDVEGKVALDANLSRRGFFYYLLQNGVVNHIDDVGYGQVMLYTHVPI